MTPPTAHPHQFASVQFGRGSSIRPGKPRHPWHWCIMIQRGHITHISTGWATLGEAEQDFRENGVAMVDKIERELAAMYSLNRAGGETEHYDLNVVNPGQRI